MGKTNETPEHMPVITKIVNTDLEDIDKYYILQWCISGWRDEK